MAGRTASAWADADPSTPWHTLDTETEQRRLQTGPTGLEEFEAGRRLCCYGPNRLAPSKRQGAMRRLLMQFHNILLYVMMGAALITAYLGHWVDTGVLLVAVVINAIIAFIQEEKAEAALDAIRAMLSPRATVTRDGIRREIDAADLVPGDLVVLASGDRAGPPAREMTMRCIAPSSRLPATFGAWVSARQYGLPARAMPTTIRNLAVSTDSALVISGVARNEFFDRCLLGSTVERLARTLPLPLLVVRNRVHGAYRRIVVATDFSESSRQALLAAVCLFPGHDLILYHAHQSPFAGISDDPSHVNINGSTEQEDCADFLAASELPANVLVRAVIEHGVLETTLTQYVRSHEIDLVIMGTHGRSGIMSILLGSSAAKLLDWLPCDTMVVREPRAVIV